MVLLQVEERDGATAPKHVRKAGLVPMALVEPGEATRLIQAPLGDVKQAIGHSSGVGMFELQVKGETKKRTVIVKQLDQDVVRRQLLNVTVMQITRDQVLTSDVPVTALGTPEAVNDHVGVLLNPTSHVKVKGKAMDLPSHIEVDVSAMQIGDSITVEHISLPAGVEISSSHDAVVFSLQPLRQEIEEAPSGEEAMAEPERIGEDSSETGEE
ncbi:MAG TPA: 50S ribosomal protein L25 [Fimbriimonadaceae bacterium]|nr:50S ribosomal protein L25 [Fimbriimonadaceae bacterium]